MEINKLLHLYAAHPKIKAVVSSLEKGTLQHTFLKGLKGSSAAMTIASLYLKKGGSYLCIMNDLEEAGYFFHDLTQLLGDKNLFFFPSAYHRHIKYGQPDPANEILRTSFLTFLQNDAPSFIAVTHPAALAERVFSKAELSDHTLKISAGETINHIELAEHLDGLQFTQTDYVYEPGQYAIRGSIMDIFSFAHEYPFRLDFFGNTIDSIRSFDVDSQLSKEQKESIYIIPEVSKNSQSDASLFDLIPSFSHLVIRDLSWCAEQIESIQQEEVIVPSEDEEEEQLTKKKHLINKEAFLQAITPFSQIHLTPHQKITMDQTLSFEIEPQPLYQKNFDLVGQSFQHFQSEGYTIYLLSDSRKQIERITAIFSDRGEEVHFTPVNKTLHSGFIDHDDKVVLFTDHQLFGRFHKYNLKSDQARSGKISLSLKELHQFTSGDYIVHIDHGVGQFGGLVRTEVNGKIQEAIKLLYHNNDILFVSIHSLHKLSKYKGKDSTPPKINKLGSGVWERTKARTKKKVKDIARDLIQLYAQRKEEKGYPFSPDSFMQDELEASFIYEDTPDQLKATADVKGDMESERPMDRLICGDVGFGKTEVAVRAAFKAVADNKQVALLVPTTVLAFQHYKTFTERLKGFPCTIDYISRARTAKEIKAILERLKEGSLNILIGTHRLVSQDVQFQDLGLLIIDEEQKFGVSVKEKLRRLKSNVDTLTMTATPIPRTLQFSLLGARDMSNILTPPPNRYPIETEVTRFTPEIIREAIEFEMSRNGQVFFINNRIQNMDEIAAMIQREVPDVRIAIGHGQMAPEKMERTILDFAYHEYDLLLSTSIVENGLDIPNANTIIVNNAHQFGLSELHQLRGRVGRSNRKAFCYLLSPPLSSLSQESRRRLQAIENFSDLGSGIHIAMQDLDIRGAGNMLGAEQSGFIADLGYEVYQKILNEAMHELKSDEFAHLFEAKEQQTTHDAAYVQETFVESDLELMFPPTYIPNDSERVNIYRELDALVEESDLFFFKQKLQDRFGKIPQEGEELLRVIPLRQIAKSLGVEKIVLKKELMRIHLPSNTESPYYQSAAFGKWIHYIQRHPKLCTLSEQHGKRTITIRKISSMAMALYTLQQVDQIDENATSD